MKSCERPVSEIFASQSELGFGVDALMLQQLLKSKSGPLWATDASLFDNFVNRTLGMTIAIELWLLLRLVESLRKTAVTEMKKADVIDEGLVEERTTPMAVAELDYYLGY
jgi:hypothetical protein